MDVRNPADVYTACKGSSSYHFMSGGVMPIGGHAGRGRPGELPDLQKPYFTTRQSRRESILRVLMCNLIGQARKIEIRRKYKAWIKVFRETEKPPAEDRARADGKDLIFVFWVPFFSHIVHIPSAGSMTKFLSSVIGNKQRTTALALFNMATKFSRR